MRAQSIKYWQKRVHNTFHDKEEKVVCFVSFNRSFISRKSELNRTETNTYYNNRLDKTKSGKFRICFNTESVIKAALLLFQKPIKPSTDKNFTRYANQIAEITKWSRIFEKQ
jgi:hypothetical protein